MVAWEVLRERQEEEEGVGWRWEKGILSIFVAVECFAEESFACGYSRGEPEPQLAFVHRRTCSSKDYPTSLLLQHQPHSLFLCSEPTFSQQKYLLYHKGGKQKSPLGLGVSMISI